MGAYLRGFVSRSPQRKELKAEIYDREEPEYAGMVDAVFTVLVRRRFDPAGHVREVRQFVARCRARYGRAAVLGLEMEALIRFRLGETGVAVDDIGEDDTLRQSILAIDQIVPEFGLRGGGPELDALIVAAEQLADERGLHPLPRLSS
ncbi:hypothetical protein AB0M46_12205 [Dactylosporangium sp. NPDC051485]|uniref:hypothetical protein n=1 Tax=Dactylosporangium sp. NPDC051485 TaxID=3154846 RepID=UPI0034364ADF